MTSPPNIYLDNAATSFPKPPAVLDAVQQYLSENGANYGRGQSDEAEQNMRIFTETRRLLGDVIDAKNPERIAFTYNCTDSLNLALNGFLERGDEVITSVLEHNAVLRPLFYLKKQLGLRVIMLSPDNKGIIRPEQVEKYLSHRTKAVVLTGMSNVQGIPQPLHEIGRLVKAKSDALFLVDGAQRLGHFPLSCTDDLIDIFCFAPHKGLLAPPGLGGIYLAPHVSLKPGRLGGTAATPSQALIPETYPDLIEAGTPNLPAVWGLHAALKFLSDLKEREGALEERLGDLSTALLQGFRKIPGLRVHIPDDTERIYGAISVSLDNQAPEDVAMMLLEAYGIRIRAGLHCAPLTHQWLGTQAQGSCRFSPGIFTGPEDVKQAIAAMAEIAITNHPA